MQDFQTALSVQKPVRVFRDALFWNTLKPDVWQDLPNRLTADKVDGRVPADLIAGDFAQESGCADGHVDCHGRTSSSWLLWCEHINTLSAQDMRLGGFLVHGVPVQGLAPSFKHRRSK